MSNGVLPLDDDDRPAVGLWDATGHQIVAAQAGAVSTDSTTGVKYGLLQSALSSAATGYVAAYGSNAAALTSSTDYAFKWGAAGTTQINHLMIQNNTASSLNFDLDVAATAGSPVLAAGQTIFFDVQTTVLHLFQAGTPNVNGSSASNIVVRGWL